MRESLAREVEESSRRCGRMVAATGAVALAWAGAGACGMTGSAPRPRPLPGDTRQPAARLKPTMLGRICAAIDAAAASRAPGVATSCKCAFCRIIC